MKKKKFSLRKLIFTVLIILFGAYVWTHSEELFKVLDTLAKGSWRWLFLAAATQALHYVVYTYMTKLSFKMVEIKRDFKDLLPLVLGALFVNVLAPTAGQSGAILFADDAVRRKESSVRAVVGTLISIVSGYTSFLVVLIFALIYLKTVNYLDYFEVIGALIFILPTSIPTVLIYTAFKKPKWLTKILSLIYKFTKWVLKVFKKEEKIDEKWPEKITKEMELAASSIAHHRRLILPTLALGLLAHIISIFSLFFIFISFDIHVRYGGLIAGYAIAEVVRVISPHPEGVGAVEAVMALIYTSFGVPPIDATAIAISFRALNFWIPLSIGFFYLRKLKSFQS